MSAFGELVANLVKDDPSLQAPGAEAQAEVSVPVKEYKKNKLIEMTVEKGHIRTACQHWLYDKNKGSSSSFLSTYGVTRGSIVKKLNAGLRAYGEMYAFMDFDFPDNQRKSLEQATSSFMSVYFPEYK